MASGHSETLRAHQRVAHSLRQQVRGGQWLPGTMIPGRHRLAKQHGVALSTVERAVATLISEGMLRADDRRGTFVEEAPAESAMGGAAPTTTGAAAGAVVSGRGAVQATVGIVAAVVPYESPQARAGQWPAQIVAECEHVLAGEAGVTQRFVNRVVGIGKEEASMAAATERLVADGVDGLVLVGDGEMAGCLSLAARAGVPVVCAAYDPSEAFVPQVYVDSVAGGALAARHLRERGYRELVFLRPFRSVWAEARLRGAETEVGAGMLQVFPLETSWTLAENELAPKQIEAGATAGRALLRVGLSAGTGVIAPNDAVAMGFAQAAQAKGLEPGRDFGLVGFDDYWREAHLTSLRPPVAQLGREAAGMLLRLLRGETAPAHIALQHRLIPRASTAPRMIENQQEETRR